MRFQSNSSSHMRLQSNRAFANYGSCELTNAEPPTRFRLSAASAAGTHLWPEASAHVIIPSTTSSGGLSALTQNKPPEVSVKRNKTGGQKMRNGHSLPCAKFTFIPRRRMHTTSHNKFNQPKHTSLDSGPQHLSHQAALDLAALQGRSTCQCFTECNDEASWSHRYEDFAWFTVLPKDHPVFCAMFEEGSFGRFKLSFATFKPWSHMKKFYDMAHVTRQKQKHDLPYWSKPSRL